MPEAIECQSSEAPVTENSQRGHNTFDFCENVTLETRVNLANLIQLTIPHDLLSQ